MDIKQIEELRQKYIKNPPEGMSARDVRDMSDEALLDMDYFLNEDDLFDENLFDDDLDSGGFFIF